MFWLQLQFFSPCSVGIHCCNVSPFLYRILSFQNIICNNFVLNGTPKFSNPGSRPRCSVVAEAAKSRGCNDLRPWSLRASRNPAILGLTPKIASG